MENGKYARIWNGRYSRRSRSNNKHKIPKTIYSLDKQSSYNKYL